MKPLHCIFLIVGALTGFVRISNAQSTLRINDDVPQYILSFSEIEYVENSSESIFEINCYNWDTGGNWGIFMFAGDWKKFNTPTNDLIAAFDAEGDVIRKNLSVTFGNVTGKWTDSY